MRSFKTFYFLLTIILLNACSNNEVRTSYKNERYSIIKGINASQSGKYSLAIEEYTKAYSYNTNNIFTLRELGMLYGLTGDLKNSEFFYKKALDVNNNDSISIFNLAVLYYNEGKYEESLQIISNTPTESISSDTKKIKGFNYYNLNKKNEAYEELNSIKNDIENDIEFAIIYSKLLIDVRKINELHPYIHNLYTKNTRNIDFVILYCKHLIENLGRNKEAEKIYRDFLIQNGPNKPLIMEITHLEYQHGNYLEARKYINLIPENSKYDLDVLELKYNIYEKLDDVQKKKEIEILLSKIKKE